VLGSLAVAAYELEFYQDENGDEPVRRWLREDLTPAKRKAIGRAMNDVLQTLGVGVCGTEFGKQLGRGLFEFRLRRDLRERTSRGEGEPVRILLRVFCHAHGHKLILLLGAYDKGEDPVPPPPGGRNCVGPRPAQGLAAAGARQAGWTLDGVKHILFLVRDPPGASPWVRSSAIS